MPATTMVPTPAATPATTRAKEGTAITNAVKA